MLKTIISTLFITLLAATFIVKFFFTNILSLFGLAILPLENLKSLQYSTQVVKKMQNRHKAKNANISKRFIKRSGTKVAVTAVSAATIGTVAVIGTLTYLEISQYCDDKYLLNEDANVLFNTENEFDMKSCLEQGKQDSVHFANEAWRSIKEKSNDVLDEIERSSNELLDPTRKTTAELFESIDKWYNQNIN